MYLIKAKTAVIPLEMGETGKSSPLPFTRGGLGWGNLRNNSNQITCVYTVGASDEGAKMYLIRAETGVSRG